MALDSEELFCKSLRHSDGIAFCFFTYNLGQNCWEKIKICFSVKPPFSPEINVVSEVFSFWQQDLARFNIDIGW